MSSAGARFEQRCCRSTGRDRAPIRRLRSVRPSVRTTPRPTVWGLERFCLRSWPRPTSTMLVAQASVRNRPRRHIRCSSRPSASVPRIRSVSASSSASPQRRTDMLTGRQVPTSSFASVELESYRPGSTRSVAPRVGPYVRCQVPVPVLQVGSGSCVTHRGRFQAALMRDGRPPALANAPCSRLRSWRIGCTRSTSPPAVISTLLSTIATCTWRPRCALPAR